MRGSAATALGGLVPALGNLFGAVATLAIGAFVALFTCFFLLNDGHSLAARTATRLPLPLLRAKQLLDQAANTIRRYFVGLTVLGVFNAVVVVIGALILDVPLVGAIAVITLLGSFCACRTWCRSGGCLRGADRARFGRTRRRRCGCCWSSFSPTACCRTSSARSRTALPWR